MKYQQQTTLTVGKNFPIRSGEVMRIRRGGQVTEEWEAWNYRGHPMDKFGKEDENKKIFDLVIRRF